MVWLTSSILPSLKVITRLYLNPFNVRIESLVLKVGDALLVGPSPELKPRNSFQPVSGGNHTLSLNDPAWNAVPKERQRACRQGDRDRSNTKFHPPAAIGRLVAGLEPDSPSFVLLMRNGADPADSPIQNFPNSQFRVRAACEEHPTDKVIIARIGNKLRMFRLSVQGSSLSGSRVFPPADAGFLAPILTSKCRCESPIPGYSPFFLLAR